ncbi:MAG TPA: hypothetical protein DCG24_03800, partial [Bacteroidetes bacterium]|nr:hypothetical protein [Bacteroidota bacterium]
QNNGYGLFLNRSGVGIFFFFQRTQKGRRKRQLIECHVYLCLKLAGRTTGSTIRKDGAKVSLFYLNFSVFQNTGH